MLTYDKIYEAYKSTGLYNFLLESLASDNKYARNSAINEINKKNFKTEGDVIAYVGMCI